MKQKPRLAPPPDRLLNAVGVISRLTPQGGPGPSPRTLELWRASGKGPAYIKIGHRIAYRESAVEAWLAQQTRSSTNDRAAE